MFRLRDNIPHYVFCPEKGQARDRNTPRTYAEKKFREQSDRFIQQSALLALEGIENPSEIKPKLQETLERSNEDYWQYSCLLGSLDQYEVSNLRKCLIYALEESGHDIEVVQWGTDETLGKKEKQAREEVLVTHATEIFNAPDISYEQARSLAKRNNATKEEQRQIEKAFILNRLPGIKESTTWTEEFILDNHIKQRDFISKQERFWLLENPHISAKRHEVDWFFHYQREFFYLGAARKSNHSTVWALKQLNITQFYQGEWHKDSPEVLELVAKGENPDIALALGFTQGTKTANGKERIEYLRRLLDLLGVKFGKGQKRTVGNQRVRVYSVDVEAWNDPTRLKVIESVSQKFTEWFESDKSKVTWIEPTPQKVTEIDSSPGLATVSASVRTPPITYKHGGVWTLPLTQVEHSLDSELNQDEPTDLVDQLAAVATPDEFTQVIKDLPSEAVQDAIASQDSQTRRLQLSQWFASAEVVEKTEPVEALASAEAVTQENQLPPLESYQLGDEVWGFFPMSEAKWLKAAVVAIGHGFIRIKAGFFGQIVERADAIAPGHWQLT
jgi:hypothetical protein